MNGVVAEEKHIFLIRMASLVFWTESKNISAVEVFAVPLKKKYDISIFFSI